MTILDKFKDPALAKHLISAIERLAKEIDRPISIMEVCGTHTVAIARSGFRNVMPKNMKLISGPGCPVCVSSNADIDRIIALTKIPDIMVATFGDMIRVPGSSTSLMQCKAQGASIEVIYSPLDALRIADENPSKNVVFVGVGFETTTPLIAATILRAKSESLQNFSVLAVHKQVPPALKALVDDPEVKLDALILPGHVSTILGVEPYEFLAKDHRIPGVITGFEPVDILQGIAQLLEQLSQDRATIEIAYKRAVMADGNHTAMQLIDQVFESCDANWRGLGTIPNSGCQIKNEFATFDATKRFELQVEPTIEPKGCKCGEVLRGVMSPNDCPLYSKVCTPVNPIGPCMVSSEGSCAAYHRYQIKD